MINWERALGSWGRPSWSHNTMAVKICNEFTTTAFIFAPIPMVNAVRTMKECMFCDRGCYLEIACRSNEVLKGKSRGPLHPSPNTDRQSWGYMSYRMVQTRMWTLIAAEDTRNTGLLLKSILRLGLPRLTFMKLMPGKFQIWSPI